jgi:adenosylcobinamide-GDP ribazoletransferase
VRQAADLERGGVFRHARGWGELVAAVGLLTRVPVVTDANRVGAAAFGLVGGAIGLIGAAVLAVVSPIAGFAGPVLGLVTIAILSGALHLDGLADTADALAAPSAEAAERARRDPRAGPAGIVAIVAVLAIDWSFLSELLARSATLAAAGLVIATTVSRALAAVSPSLARQRFRDGLGAWFAARTTGVDGMISVITAVAIAAVLGTVLGRPVLVLVAVLGLMVGGMAVLVVERLRGGLDGDGLGAIIEIALAGALFAAVVAA